MITITMTANLIITTKTKNSKDQHNTTNKHKQKQLKKIKTDPPPLNAKPKTHQISPQVSSSTKNKMAIDPSLTETDIFDEVLKYGLFLGAIFQLVCIGAVIFVPSRDDKRVSAGGDKVDCFLKWG